jgi:hypothetical protein
MKRTTCLAIGLCALLAGRVATAAPMLGCDFNDDAVCNVMDLDDLGHTAFLGSNDPAFDINADGLVNQTDVDQWLVDAGTENLPFGAPYPPSDVNLSGQNTLEDSQILVSNLGLSVSSYSQGDLDFSGLVDTTDRDRYVAAGGIVPEPGSLALLSSGLAALAWLRSRHRA